MGRTNQDYAQEHPEVEYEENLRLGEGQHHDAGELGKRDAAKHVAAHLHKRRGDLLVGGHLAHGVRVHYMAAEFYRYTDTLKKNNIKMVSKYLPTHITFQTFFKI